MQGPGESFFHRSIPFWVIVLLAVCLWGGEYLRRDLWAPDEARYAYIAREMLETGEFLVPHRHGEYYAHKPPLMFWLIAAGSKLTGEINALCTRLPSFLGALLSLWATSRLALRWGGVGASWRAPLILMTCALFWAKGGMGQIDSLLCGLEMTALLLLFTIPIRNQAGGAELIERGAVAWRMAAAFLCMGLAILAKGPVGLLVPVLAFVVGSLAAGEGRRLATWHWLWAVPLGLSLPGLWLLLVAQGGPPEGYLDELLFKQNVGRAAGDFGHKNPFYFFLLTYPGEFLPWSLFLPAAFLTLRRAGGEGWRTARRLIGWALAVIVFFSLSPSKRDLYILAAFPAGALLLAIAWDGLSQAARRWEARGTMVVLGILGIGCLGAAVFGWLRPGDIPMNVLWVLPSGLVALSSVGWLLRRAGGRGDVFGSWFFGLWGGLFLLLISVGSLVYPALNAEKAPGFLREVAEEHIPEGGQIFLFQIKGEIFALYAERPGRYFSGPKALTRAMNAQGEGVLILRESYWDRLPPALQARVLSRNPFRTGSKKMIWCDFGPQVLEVAP